MKLRAEAGSLLFPGFSANKFNTAPKALMAELRFDRDNEYSPMAFRRGAEQDILETGAALAVIITSGQWAAAE